MAKVKQRVPLKRFIKLYKRKKQGIAPADFLQHCLTLSMEAYKPVSKEVYEALEEIYLLKDTCNLTFEEGGARRTLVNTRLIDLNEEGDGPYVTTEGGTRIRLDHIIAINGKPVIYFV